MNTKIKPECQTQEEKEGAIKLSWASVVSHFCSGIFTADPARDRSAASRRLKERDWYMNLSAKQACKRWPDVKVASSCRVAEKVKHQQQVVNILSWKRPLFECWVLGLSLWVFMNAPQAARPDDYESSTSLLSEKWVIRWNIRSTAKLYLFKESLWNFCPYSFTVRHTYKYNLDGKLKCLSSLSKWQCRESEQ